MRPSFCREPNAAGAVQADGRLSAEGGKEAARILLPELSGTASAAESAGLFLLRRRR